MQTTYNIFTAGSSYELQESINTIRNNPGVEVELVGGVSVASIHQGLIFAQAVILKNKMP